MCRLWEGHWAVNIFHGSRDKQRHSRLIHCCSHSGLLRAAVHCLSALVYDAQRGMTTRTWDTEMRNEESMFESSR